MPPRGNKGPRNEIGVYKDNARHYMHVGGVEGPVIGSLGHLGLLVDRRGIQYQPAPVITHATCFRIHAEVDDRYVGV